MKLLMIGTIGVLAIVLLTVNSAVAEKSVGRCSALSNASEPAMVCGRGKNALVVVSGTQSPDNRFAVAWRDGRKKTDPDWVDSFLVRLSDGSLIARLSGKFAGANGELYSHEDVTTYWNLDGSIVAVIVSQKWETRSLHIYMRAYDGRIIRHGDFFAKIEKAVQRHIKRTQPKLARFGYTTTLQPGAVVRRGEAVHLEVLMQVPKSDNAPVLEYKLTLDVDQDGVRIGPFRP